MGRKVQARVHGGQTRRTSHSLAIEPARRCFGRDKLTYPPTQVQHSGLRTDSMIARMSRIPSWVAPGRAAIVGLCEAITSDMPPETFSRGLLHETVEMKSINANLRLFKTAPTKRHRGWRRSSWSETKSVDLII